MVRVAGAEQPGVVAGAGVYRFNAREKNVGRRWEYAIDCRRANAPCVALDWPDRAANASR